MGGSHNIIAYFTHKPSTIDPVSAWNTYPFLDEMSGLVTLTTDKLLGHLELLNIQRLLILPLYITERRGLLVLCGFKLVSRYMLEFEM